MVGLVDGREVVGLVEGACDGVFEGRALVGVVEGT